MLNYEVNLLKRLFMLVQDLTEADSPVEGTGHKIGHQMVLFLLSWDSLKSEFRHDCHKSVNSQVDID